MSGTARFILFGGFLLGGAAIVGLIAWTGAREVATALARGGSALPWLILVHGGQILACAVAWRAATTGAESAPSLLRFARLRWIREAVELLPVMQIGGIVAAGRMLALSGRKGAGLGATVAAASTIVDVTAEVVAQAVFTLLGLALLVGRLGDTPVTNAAAVGAVLVIAASIAFVVAQRRGLKPLERMFDALAQRIGWGDEARLGGTQEAVRRAHADIGAMVVAVAGHFVAWSLGMFEVWAVAQALGFDLALLDALLIESLLQAVKSCAFLVPGALGVQEGALVALFALFGLPADAALALSLLKRARDVIYGVPGLIAWQLDEGRRLLARGRT
ncbi:MAG: rane protein [Rhodospirillales bacterium]|nr:rane protein [Rhodospirillales bacterium]